MKNQLPEEFYQLRSQVKSTKPKTISLTRADVEEILDSIDWADSEPSWPQTPRDRAIVFLRHWLGVIDGWLWSNLSINQKPR